MTIGIERFREIARYSDLPNRRVTERGQQGFESIEAKNNLWGRIVNWWKGPNHQDEMRAGENWRARTAFYNALVKAEGKDFVDKVIRDTLKFENVEDFTKRRTDLTGYRINQVLNALDREVNRNTSKNLTTMGKFTVPDGNLATVARTMTVEDHPDLDPNDPEIEQTFRSLILAHPDYGHKELTQDDLNGFGREAVRLTRDAKKARFEEQYPHLSKLENGHFHDTRTYFTGLRQDLDSHSISLSRRLDMGQTDLWFKNAMTEMQTVSRSLGEMHFDPIEAKLQMEDAQRLRTRLEALTETVPDLRFVEAETVIARHAKDEALRLNPIGETDEQQDGVRVTIDTAFTNYMAGLRDNPDRNLTSPDVQAGLVDHLCEALDAYLIEQNFGDGREQTVAAFRQSLTEQLANHPDFQIIREARAANEPLLQAMLREIDNQVGKLNTKIQFLNDYVTHDPLSKKYIKRDAEIWAKAGTMALENIKRDLETQLVTERTVGRRSRLIEDIQTVTDLLVTANQRELDARVDTIGASTERGNVNPGAHNDVKSRRESFKRNRSVAIERLNEYYDRAQITPRVSVRKALDRARAKVIEGSNEWLTISRDIVVTRDGLTRTYRNELKPGKEIGIVGQSYGFPQRGIGGGSTKDLSRPRNLQVSTLYLVDSNDPDRVEVKSQIIRHGVLDSWDIDDQEERIDSSEDQVIEVLKTSAQLSTRAAVGRDPPAKIVHVNIGLSTPDPTGRHLDRRDGEFFQNQIDSFEHDRFDDGPITLPILVPPDDPNGQRVRTEVDFYVENITFVFAIRGTEMKTNKFDEHDRQNMVKLLGDLTANSEPGGHIGDIVAKLTERAKEAANSDERRKLEALIVQLRNEVDLVRREFTSERYKTAKDDPYRMPRLVMRLVDLGAEALRTMKDTDVHMSLSEGCRHNTDGGGISDVELKSQVIIEDMGGEALPGVPLEDEDLTIYNTVLTGSGQHEALYMSMGVTGGRGVGLISGRSQDPDAMDYALGSNSKV